MGESSSKEIGISLIEENKEESHDNDLLNYSFDKENGDHYSKQFMGDQMNDGAVNLLLLDIDEDKDAD